MQMSVNQGCLTLDHHTGGIVSFLSHGRELIASGDQAQPLFALRFRDPAGNPRIISSLQGRMRADPSPEGTVLHYAFSPELPLDVTVTVAAKKDGAFALGLRLHHELPGFLEYIEMPMIRVPSDFIANGGKGSLLWPAMEGVLVEDAGLREMANFKYRPVEYPNHGWCGYYPGCVQMQFMAYMREGAGLYLASHDAACTTKEIEYCQQDDGVHMIFRIYPGAIPAGEYVLPFEMVLKPFAGDWQVAADIYRTWVEASTLPLPPKLKDRPDREAWLEASPIVVTYPVTGIGHHAGPTKPNEFFPFTQALPAIARAAEKTNSTILALPMHWEGTSPWAPPYVWPPRGGEENMRQFADALHAAGHQLGLYCSGLAWTNTAVTGDGGYDRREEFERRHLINEMCQGPQGQYQSLICNGDDLRWGYDFCATSKVARDIVLGEARKIAAAGVDYIQLFDQNLGAAAYQCYDARHGHPGAPGSWQAAAMRGLLAHFKTELSQAGYSQVRLGCESAAAEPYIEYLPLNDLRFFIGYNFGRPVSALAYVYHEYTTNFMGNQCEVMEWIDGDKSPHNLALRYAHSFVAGDLLTVILKNGGEMHWAWCCKWDVTPPEQDKHWRFVGQLNAWRRGVGKPFLYFGRMLVPHPLEGAKVVPLYRRAGRGGKTDFPSVLTSRWISPDGQVAQVLVNYTDESQQVTIGCSQSLTVYDAPDATPRKLATNHRLTLPPMTAIMVVESDAEAHELR